MSEAMRLNRFLSDAGVCSRREADRLTKAGLVTVNGQKAEPGMRVSGKDCVCVRGKPVLRQENRVILLMNKPRGYICTTQRRERPNVMELMDYPVRVYPVGRLDRDSEGLLLFTNDGELVNRIMRAGNYHEKEYIVTIDRPVTDAFLQQIRDGVPILDTVTRPCTAEKLSRNTMQIVLTQGLNRQIRRMCEYLGCRVVRLRRVRIMNLRLDGIREGAWREIRPEERETLLRLLKDSRSGPWKGDG